MQIQNASHRADPEILKGWLSARSVVRSLPQPVPDHGGWRVETGLPEETRRFVFVHPHRGIHELAQSIVAPNIYIKLCATGEELLALVPPRWQLQAGRYLMTYAGPCETMPSLGAGYRLEISTAQNVTSARIMDKDGALAASGYAAEYDGFFSYDKIGTEPGHRRQGLGRAVMTALGTARRSSSSRQVLVATEEGRALYSTLGWIVHSPYATAVIPVTPVISTTMLPSE